MGYITKSLTIVDAMGNKKRLKFYGNTEREVEEKLLRAKIEYENGTLVVTSKTPFAKWSRQYLDTYVKPFTGHKNFQIIETIARDVFSELNAMPMSDIRPVHLAAQMNSLTGASKSRITKAYTFIRGCFREAYRNGILRTNPADGLKIPSYTENERRNLTKEECRALIASVGKTKQSVFFAVMFFTGMRPGEVKALTWNDVDMETKHITVRSAVKVDGEIGETKTRSGNRIIIMPQMLYDILSQQQRGIGYVFGGSKPWTEQQYKRSWASFKNAIDRTMGAQMHRNQIIIHSDLGQDITPYYLRHNYATLLAEGGVDVRAVAYLMGHKFTDITSHYTHITPEYVDGQRNRIDAIFKNIVSNDTKDIAKVDII